MLKLDSIWPDLWKSCLDSVSPLLHPLHFSACLTTLFAEQNYKSEVWYLKLSYGERG